MTPEDWEYVPAKRQTEVCSRCLGHEFSELLERMKDDPDVKRIHSKQFEDLLDSYYDWMDAHNYGGDD